MFGVKGYGQKDPIIVTVQMSWKIQSKIRSNFSLFGTWGKGVMRENDKLRYVNRGLELKDGNFLSDIRFLWLLLG